MESYGWDSQGWDAQDEELWVVAAQAGDLRAFDRLGWRYRPALISIARQILKSKELAEDAAQEALLIAFGALPQLSDPTRFGGWLGSILRNRAIRLSKGERKAPTPLDEIVLAYSPSLTADLAVREQNQALYCAIAELPEELRPVVELYYLNEWSVREVAEVLNLPETTVKWRLHTARRQLRSCLSPLIEEEEQDEREPE